MQRASLTKRSMWISEIDGIDNGYGESHVYYYAIERSDNIYRSILQSYILKFIKSHKHIFHIQFLSLEFLAASVLQVSYIANKYTMSSLIKICI